MNIKAHTSSATTAKADVFTRVTEKIIADLEAGVRPCTKPWDAGHAQDRIALPLRANGVAYRGINILLLWGEAMAKGYRSCHWLTFRQAQALGAQVRRGEHGSLVVYASTVTRTETADNGEETEYAIPFMKGYTVFNADQIDDLPAHFQRDADPAPPCAPFELTGHAEQFFARTGVQVKHGGTQAFYSPAADYVQMPPASCFRDAESYTATKAHEVIHWTSHPTRLDRQLGKRFGDHAYAAEELVAEMGAAFLCAQLGMTPEIREDHAAYIGEWLTVLRGDRKAIFTAASKAQQACDYLFTLQDASR